jgi:hypothetical protein
MHPASHPRNITVRLVRSAFRWSVSFWYLVSRLVSNSNAFVSFLGIMIDAGSTGSRVHVFKYVRSDEDLVLESEEFLSIKPGLSSFKVGTFMHVSLPVDCSTDGLFQLPCIIVC